MTEAERQAKIRKVRKLIERGSTPGEKAAARAALARLRPKPQKKAAKRTRPKPFISKEKIFFYCRYCSRRQSTYDPKKKYCSEECKREARREQDRDRKEQERRENRNPELTYCRLCNRPLTDSYSIKLGIGPECRKGRTGRKFK